MNHSYGTKTTSQPIQRVNYSKIKPFNFKHNKKKINKSLGVAFQIQNNQNTLINKSILFSIKF